MDQSMLTRLGNLVQKRFPAVMKAFDNADKVEALDEFLIWLMHNGFEIVDKKGKAVRDFRPLVYGSLDINWSEYHSQIQKYEEWMQ